MVLSLIMLGAFVLSGTSLIHVNASGEAASSATSLDLAQQAASLAVAQIMNDQFFGNHDNTPANNPGVAAGHDDSASISIVPPGAAPGNGGFVYFPAASRPLGALYSVNANVPPNVATPSAVPKPDGQGLDPNSTPPTTCADVIGTGIWGGVVRHYEMVVYFPAIPYPLWANGVITSHGGLHVAGISDSSQAPAVALALTQSPPSGAFAFPASAASFASSGNAIVLTASDLITGNAEARGGIGLPAAPPKVVLQSVVAGDTTVPPPPAYNYSNYDPAPGGTPTPNMQFIGPVDASVNTVLTAPPGSPYTLEGFNKFPAPPPPPPPPVDTDQSTWPTPPPVPPAPPSPPPATNPLEAGLNHTMIVSGHLMLDGALLYVDGDLVIDSGTIYGNGLVAVSGNVSINQNNNLKDFDPTISTGTFIVCGGNMSINSGGAAGAAAHNFFQGTLYSAGTLSLNGLTVVGAALSGASGNAIGVTNSSAILYPPYVPSLYTIQVPVGTRPGPVQLFFHYDATEAEVHAGPTNGNDEYCQCSEALAESAAHPLIAPVDMQDATTTQASNPPHMRGCGNFQVNARMYQETAGGPVFYDVQNSTDQSWKTRLDFNNAYWAIAAQAVQHFSGLSADIAAVQSDYPSTPPYKPVAQMSLGYGCQQAAFPGDYLSSEMNPATFPVLTSTTYTSTNPTPQPYKVKLPVNTLLIGDLVRLLAVKVF
jgi:hypothetical protein